jgi:hypothetical protein
MPPIRNFVSSVGEWVNETLGREEESILTDLLQEFAVLVGPTIEGASGVLFVTHAAGEFAGWTEVAAFGRFYVFSPASWALFVAKVAGIFGTARAAALIIDGRALNENGIPTADFALSSAIGAGGGYLIYHTLRHAPGGIQNLVNYAMTSPGPSSLPTVAEINGPPPILRQLAPPVSPPPPAPPPQLSRIQRILRGEVVLSDAEFAAQQAEIRASAAALPPVQTYQQLRPLIEQMRFLPTNIERATFLGLQPPSIQVELLKYFPPADAASIRAAVPGPPPMAAVQLPTIGVSAANTLEANALNLARAEAGLGPPFFRLPSAMQAMRNFIASQGRNGANALLEARRQVVGELSAAIPPLPPGAGLPPPGPPGFLGRPTLSSVASTASRTVGVAGVAAFAVDVSLNAYADALDDQLFEQSIANLSPDQQQTARYNRELLRLQANVANSTGLAKVDANLQLQIFRANGQSSRGTFYLPRASGPLLPGGSISPPPAFVNRPAPLTPAQEEALLHANNNSPAMQAYWRERLDAMNPAFAPPSLYEQLQIEAARGRPPGSPRLPDGTYAPLPPIPYVPPFTMPTYVRRPTAPAAFPSGVPIDLSNLLDFFNNLLAQQNFQKDMATYQANIPPPPPGQGSGGGIGSVPAGGKNRYFWLYRGRDRDLMLQTLRDILEIQKRDTLAASGKTTTQISTRDEIFPNEVPGLPAALIGVIRALKYGLSLVRNRGPLGGYYPLPAAEFNSYLSEMWPNLIPA